MRFIIGTKNKIIEESITKPVLLWDPAAIDKLKHKKMIKELFGTNTLIEYDGVTVIWDGVVWPPSIDAMIFANTLSKFGYTNKKIKTVLDLGCGTGFLGLYMVKKNRNIKKAYFIDIDARACALAEKNAILNNVLNRCVFLEGDTYLPLNNKSIDLIICAPPYIPYPQDDNELYFDNSFAGTRLLERAILRAKDFSKEFSLLSINWHIFSMASSM